MRVRAQLLCCLLLPGMALAQAHRVEQALIEENVTYAYAQVLRASPVYEAGFSRAPAPRKIVGYDVEYQYKGEKYMSRLVRDPGNRLRVRVSVVPEPVWPGYR